MLAERDPSSSEGWPLPISKQPLPGDPEDYRHLFSGESFPVAGAFYRPSRYWLEVQRVDPIVSERSQMIGWGDLLLMESDEAWRSDHRSVDQRLCAIRSAGEDELRVKLGLVSLEPESQDDPGYFCADTFERLVDRSQLVREIVLHEYPGGRLEARPRLMREVQGEKSGNRLVPVGNLALSQTSEPLDLVDICAVCLMAVRRF